MRPAIRMAGTTAAVAALAAAILLPACGARRGPEGRGKDAAAHYRKAELAFNQRQYTEAVREMTESVRLDPANVRLRVRLAEFHFALGQWDPCEEQLREALRLEPYHADARNALGAVLSEQGRREEALAEFRRLIEDRSTPTPERVWVNIALLYDQMGNAEEAIRSFRRSIDANPKYSRAHYGLAEVLDRENRLNEAIAAYQLAAPDYGDSPEFHYRLGFACFRAGNQEDLPDDRARRLRQMAREHLETVVRRAPGSTDAMKAEELLALMR